ncbi:DUF4178 domain-containing protein, partial [bacterium]|nr:DUF4178 domain-containing protein [bacterium]
MLRKDTNVELLGKAADLQPDNTPLQVGTRGQYKGRSFEILGRIQIRQEEGYWNEWYLSYSDGREGWLGEALGEYFVSFSVPEANLPSFEKISLNDKFTFKGIKFFATNIANSVVSSYEGELPFIMTGSYNLPYVDLRSYGKQAATLDYSDGEPLLFIGTYEEFDDLHFDNLRDPEDHIEQRSAKDTVSFKCPSCGAPHTMSSAGPQSQCIVCEFCGTATDISNSNSYKILWQAQRKKFQQKPRIELGSKGKFKGVEWEVIGFQHKYSKYANQKYYWEEYLCYERCHGYRYLVLSQGHWSWCQTLHELPTGSVVLQSDQTVQGKTFKHFEGYTGYVEAVFGEFPYKVDINSKSDIQDYISPPFGLSRESELGANKEVYWSIAEHVETQDVARAFKLKNKTPEPEGIGSMQPNGYKKSTWQTTMVGLLTVTLAFLFCVFSEFREKTVYTQDFSIVTNAEPSLLTKEFEITGHTQAVEVNFNTDLDNRWVYFDMALVNTKTQEAKLFSRSLSYYHGYDSDGRWSEGEKNNYVIVPRVQPGTYVLRIDLQTGTSNTPDTLEQPKDKQKKVEHKKLVSVKMNIISSPTYWLWFWILAFVGILPVPCLYAFMWWYKESERWE